MTEARVQDSKQRSLLVWYSSYEGQTRKIAEYICNQEPDYRVDWCRLDETPEAALDSYDRILVAASIRYGHFPSALRNQVRHHFKALASSEAAFIAVCLTARKAGKDTPDTNVYVRKWLHTSPWRPKHCAVFAGALCYSRYNFWQRSIIKFIMWMTGGSRDTSRDVEYTDWNKVAIFAKQFWG